MKEIFRQYGSIMISSFVLIAIFAFFLHCGSGSDNGIFEIAGQIMESSCTNYSDSHVAGIEYVAYKQVKIPEITLNRDNQIYAGEEILVSDFLRIKDNTSGSYEIYSMQKFQGDVISNVLIKPDETVLFEDTGIYVLYLKVYGENGKKSYAKLKIPVNRR